MVDAGCLSAIHAASQKQASEGEEGTVRRKEKAGLTGQLRRRLHVWCQHCTIDVEIYVECKFVQPQHYRL